MNTNIKKIFKIMLDKHNDGIMATYVSTYKNVSKVAKMFLNIPNIVPESESCVDDFKDSNEPLILTYAYDNTLWCQEAYYSNGKIARGAGLYIIDSNVIGEHSPEEFLLDGEPTNKIIIVK